MLAVAGDIADPTVADRVIGEAVAKFGRVDTLVNNAGIFIAKPFHEYTQDDFNRKLSVNLAGFFQRFAASHPANARRRLAGHIVNLTTTLVGQPVRGVPSALASLTKGGLDAVTRSLAIEYSDRGIRVNAVGAGCHQDTDASGGDACFPGRTTPLESNGRNRRNRRGQYFTWSRHSS